MSWIDRYFFGVQTLQNQGATLPNAPTVNYSGSGVTTTVDTNTGIATVNITAGGGASQTTTALSNGLNSNVAIGGQSSVRFGGYTASVILGGITSSPVPSAGQVVDLLFTVSGQPATIRNLDASSTSTSQILTGTGGRASPGRWCPASSSSLGRDRIKLGSSAVGRPPRAAPEHPQLRRRPHRRGRVRCRVD